MAENPFSITKIGQISIPVHDIERSIEFYRDVLELPFMFSAPNMAFFECNGTRILLSIPEEEQYDHASSIFYFSVDDIQSSYEQLQTRGVTFQGEPHMIARLGETGWLSSKIRTATPML